MYRKYNIGRNDPCPCGSGKKYKKCCGAVPQTTVTARKKIDYFKLNREIAYRGKVGRQREEFCIQYIKHKQALLKKATLVQIEGTKARGETITCHKGCSFCCAQHVPASLQECEAIVPFTVSKVDRNATLYTDEFPSYDYLTRIGYRHKRIDHSSEVYARGNIHTNSIEGFWSLVKRGISGVYHSVSPQYLQLYINEYAFRYNHRKAEQPMFKIFLSRIS